MALRGHASIQGSTDIPTLFNLLPGYLPMPHADAAPGPRLATSRRTRARPASGATCRAYMVSLLKAYWGDAATAGERLLLRLPAAAHRRPLDVQHRDGADRGAGQGLLPGRGEPGGRLGQRQDAAARHGQPRLAGRARPADDRVGDVLEGRPGDRDRRAASPRTSAPRCSSCPPPRTSRRPARSRRPSGCCSGATRRSSRRATARSELQFYYELGQRIREKLAGLHRRDGPAAARPGLGLPGRRARRPRRRGGAAGDQRHRRRTAGAVGLHRAEGRRLDVVRVLDLLRRLRRRGQPVPPPQAALGAGAASRPSGAGCGPRTAGSSTTAPRPTPTASRGASARATSGGTRPPSGEGRWVGDDVPDFIADRPPDFVPADGAKGPDAIGGSDPFVMQTDGKGWLFAPAGLADGPMPAHYEPPESPVQQPALRPAEQPLARGSSSRGTTPTNPSWQRGLPVRLHDLPADRAPHRRRHEPHAAVPRRAAAGDVLRGLPAAGRRAGADQRWLGDDHHRADRHRGAGAGHRADAVAAAR